MAFVPEDGTGLSTATSGCSVAYADAYHAARGNAGWALLGNSAKEQWLQAGTRDVDRSGLQQGVHWLGCRATSTQALAVPRSGLYTPDGVAISSTAVPEFYADACAEQAWYRSESDRIAALEDRAESSVSIGRMSVSFAGGDQSRASLLATYVRELLGPYQHVGPVRA